jgi:tellurite resistance protein TerC
MLNGYSIWSVVIFAVVVTVSLLIDLFAHRSDKPVSLRSSGAWTLFWIAVSFAFAGYIWWSHGADDAFAFTSGYVLEKALSIDNLFVMMAIFASFKIPDKYQHRVLYYGILGALAMRMMFVALGVGFINNFGEYAMTAFGLFIVWSAIKMLQATGIGVLAYTMFMDSKKKNKIRADHKRKEEQEVDYSSHWSTKFFKRIMPVHSGLDGHKFFAGRAATPLFLALLTIEFADIMFAFDSVPAIIAITQKPFLVYTSNIFAILGMRSLYFSLSALKRKLRHLEAAVIATLIFIGMKMLGEVFFDWHIGAGQSLLVILGLMAVGVIWSLLDQEKST